ncbi:putative RNA-directed DNA polymerase from transposon BS [Nephila pilipes]|uniref:Putative RNA-directed DNA polymerase from transposon BS n=1 Tax=Nephila pilipes TaxID=299642 RepID=A0A8X6P7D9_NEPPI|nr:putative RNA-directed DNA polymerase from transposon BS [Nephila pilipes]
MNIAIVSETSITVFCSELVAIREALNLSFETDVDDVWVLTDSKSSIQYLRNWPNILDKLGLDIILKLAALTYGGTVRLQWIPSHVGVYGNEIVDLLFGTGSKLPTTPFTELRTLRSTSCF